MKRSSQIMPKKFFMVMTHRWRHKVASKFLSIFMFRRGIHAKKRSHWITFFEIASQRSTSQAYWVTLALISDIANYLKYHYFWDCDCIDNVTLRLWKFSDFCSRHTVGVAGDDIMFHILVENYFMHWMLTGFGQRDWWQYPGAEWGPSQQQP